MESYESSNIGASVPVVAKSALQEWLVAGRKAIGTANDEGKPGQLANELLTAGYVSRTGALVEGTIRGWEASGGTGPPKAAIPFLVIVFKRHGYTVPPPQDDAPVALSELARAIRDQTNAITQLVNALRPPAQTKAERAAALASQIEALSLELAELQRGDPDVPGTPAEQPERMRG